MTNLTPESAPLVARRFAALGEPTRLRLLDAMHSRSEVSVGDLAEEVGTSYANASKHLAVLLTERMVARRREGSRTLYRIADPALMRICDEVCEAIRGQLEELSTKFERGNPTERGRVRR